ncbi:MAG: 1,4-dihydroxy-2-naphthoate octaprenyltransferase [Odoribacteraceae bacterium]|jgi:1,4-dihydroxy-2-naphthoate octaprenyltransferase|nr:1,4-dihydroxy-2-naphthoate octaprenyltransferase [Odoribacteraceae bacterium]
MRLNWFKNWRVGRLARAYVVSARPRTLPLSVAGVLLGSLLAAGEGHFDGTVCAWAVVTTLALQVLANLANEVGDLKKGTDNEHRLGPVRGLQGGMLSLREITGAMWVAGSVAVVAGVLLVREAFGEWLDPRSGLLLLAGGGSIVAAVKYTVGRGAYGYRGLGDLFVMIFFGWVSVLGSYFAMSGAIRVLYLLPATAVGAFSVMVLNLNNMRDVANDAACGKRTLPVMWGIRRAKIYHLALASAGVASLLLLNLLSPAGPRDYLFLIALPLLLYHLREVFRREGRALDGQLRLLSLTTLLVALLAGLRGLS